MFSLSLVHGSAERQRRYRAKHKAVVLVRDNMRGNTGDICDLAGRLHDGTASRQDQLTAAALIVSLMRKGRPVLDA